MKRIEKVFLFIFTLAAIQAVAITSAHADEALLDYLDKDKDGYISLKEAVADTRLLRIFSQIDENADGLLSLEELEKSEEVALIAMNIPSK